MKCTAGGGIGMGVPPRLRQDPRMIEDSAPLIEDPRDPRLDPFRSLRVRTERGEEIAVADGLRVLETLVRLGVRPERLLVVVEAREAVERLLPSPRPEILLVERDVASELVGFRYHQGVMALLPSPRTDRTLQELGDRVVVLDRLEKGENVGAIARSALAFGFTGILFDRAGTPPIGRSSLRASRGAVCALPLRGTADLPAELDALRSEGACLIGGTLRGGVSPQELRSRVEPPLALLLGREGDGLSEEVESRLDERVEIPIDPRIESLNVAAAAAILLATLSGGAARG